MWARTATTPQTAHQGFTLIEVLVVIGVMALMGLMTWRGIDGMLRTQSGLQTRSEQASALQAGLAQWQADLDLLAELPGTPSWDWDGRVLRLTRRMAVGTDVQMVAWTWRSNRAQESGQWQRWQSDPLHLRSDWQAAWDLARQWGQAPSDSTRAGQIDIHPLNHWQLFVHRGGSWANPLSSDAVTGGGSGSSTPDGLRLVLDLPPGPAGAGTLTLDWVRPTLSTARP